MLLAIALLLALVPPSPAPADPYVIYKEALRHLATLGQPNYIDDTGHWSVIVFGPAGTSDQSEHFQRTIFNSITRRENVLAVPFSASDPPVIGESYFAPDVWLMYKRPAPQEPNSPNMRPDLSDLKVIANVISIAKPSYDIRLAGIDSLIGGGTAYHLTLRPLSDPRKHNLRELWVNTTNSDIMRAIIEGDYRPSYRDILQDTFVLEDFGRIGNYWLMIHHVWTYSAPFSAVRYQYDVTSITMRFPATVPDWFFDTGAFLRHLGDVSKTLARR